MNSFVCVLFDVHLFLWLGGWGRWVDRWLFCCLAGCLAVCLAVCLSGCLAGSLAGWLAGSLNSVTENYAYGRIPVGYAILRPYRYVLTNISL